MNQLYRVGARTFTKFSEAIEHAKSLIRDAQDRSVMIDLYSHEIDGWTDLCRIDLTYTATYGGGRVVTPVSAFERLPGPS